MEKILGNNSKFMCVSKHYVIRTCLWRKNLSDKWRSAVNSTLHKLYPVENPLTHSKFGYKWKWGKQCLCWQLNSAPTASTTLLRFLQKSQLVGGIIDSHFCPEFNFIFPKSNPLYQKFFLPKCSQGYPFLAWPVGSALLDKCVRLSDQDPNICSS